VQNSSPSFQSFVENFALSIESGKIDGSKPFWGKDHLQAAAHETLAQWDEHL
jgi:hypothetical protein